MMLTVVAAILTHLRAPSLTFVKNPRMLSRPGFFGVRSLQWGSDFGPWANAPAHMRSTSHCLRNAPYGVKPRSMGGNASSCAEQHFFIGSLTRGSTVLTS